MGKGMMTGPRIRPAIDMRTILDSTQGEPHKIVEPMRIVNGLDECFMRYAAGWPYNREPTEGECKVHSLSWKQQKDPRAFMSTLITGEIGFDPTNLIHVYDGQQQGIYGPSHTNGVWCFPEPYLGYSKDHAERWAVSTLDRSRDNCGQFYGALLYLDLTQGGEQIFNMWDTTPYYFVCEGIVYQDWDDKEVWTPCAQAAALCSAKGTLRSAKFFPQGRQLCLCRLNFLRVLF